MIIDLSHPVHPGMPVFPGDRETAFETVLTHDRDGFSVHALVLGSHAGTHLDAPFHRHTTGKTVDADEILAACVGEALVIDVSDSLVNGEIALSSLGPQADQVFPGSRILLATGWSAHMGSADFFQAFPSVSEELAQFLVERKIVLLGVESPSLHVSKDSLIHDILLGNGIVVVENLANLMKLAREKVFFSAAPLKLKGLDGSPVRAYAVV